MARAATNTCFRAPTPPIDAVCSIDEFAATVEPRDIPAALTHQIKQRLRDAVGDHITCSIGYAPNRWLAKIAAINSINATRLGSVSV